MNTQNWESWTNNNRLPEPKQSYKSLVLDKIVYAVKIIGEESEDGFINIPQSVIYNGESVNDSLDIKLRVIFAYNSIFLNSIEKWK